MKWWRILRTRVGGLVGNERFTSELDDELDFHLRNLAEDKVRHGLSAAEAQREALREFGNFALIKDECRDIGAGGALEACWQDLRFAARNLWRQKAFSAIALLTLVLGIGANTTLFTVLSSVLLRPIPFSDSDQLMAIWSRENTDPSQRFPLSYPDLVDLRNRNHSFEAIGAYRSEDFVVARPNHAGLHVHGAMMTHDIFHLLRARPTIGRAFRSSDDDPGVRSVIISDKLWHEQFGGASDCLGDRLLVNGEPYSVIGVMPPEFQFPLGNQESAIRITCAKLWDVFTVDTLSLNTHRDAHYLGAIGRLRSGVTRFQAEADLKKVAEDNAKDIPGDESHL